MNVLTLMTQQCKTNKLSLKRWLLAKRKHKAPAQTSKVMYEPEVFDGDVLPTEPATPSMSPVIPTASDTAPQLVDQVKSMLDSFRDSMETRFTSIDHRFSQFSVNSLDSCHSLGPFVAGGSVLP